MVQRKHPQDDLEAAGAKAGGFIGRMLGLLPPRARVAIMWAAITALTSGGIGFGVARVGAPPTGGGPSHQDSVNTQSLMRIESKMEGGFSQQDDRLDRMEGILAKVARRTGVDRQVRAERRDRSREDSLRRELFPYGAGSDDQAWGLGRGYER